MNFEKGGGLVPAIAVDAATGEVLTLAYMDEAALARTRETGFVHYYSRSRGRLWKKGEESGHVQEVRSIELDCDRDALVVRVVPHGPACHTGERTCFHNAILNDAAGSALLDLEKTLLARKASPVEGSHTTRLLADENLRLKKVTEEAGEVVMAAKDRDAAKLTSEIADLVYHALVAGVAGGVTPSDVMRELARRQK